MIKISFLGDILCQMPFLEAAQKRDNDFYTTYSKLNSLLSDSDFVVANLETPIAGANQGYSSAIYSFNTPDVFLDALKNVKIDLYLTANNHTLDRGIDGLKNTIFELNKRKMAHTGTAFSENESTYFLTTIGDVKIAFLSFTACVNETVWKKYGKLLADHDLNLMIDIDKYFAYREVYKSRTIPLYHIRKKLGSMIPKSLELKIKSKMGIKLRPMVDNEPLKEVCGTFLEKTKSVIDKAKKEADLVIFLPHCGGQFNKEPGKLSKSLFQKLFEFDVDAVIGGHPHTIQKCGHFNDKPYAFSLGNVSTSPSYPFFLKEANPEYGMIFHAYVEGKKIVKTTFSIIKSVEEPDRYPIVWPISELNDILPEENKPALENDVNLILKRIFGDSAVEYGVQKEYEV